MERNREEEEEATERGLCFVLVERIADDGW